MRGLYKSEKRTTNIDYRNRNHQFTGFNRRTLKVQLVQVGHVLDVCPMGSATVHGANYEESLPSFTSND